MNFVIIKRERVPRNLTDLHKSTHNCTRVIRENRKRVSRFPLEPSILSQPHLPLPLLLNPNAFIPFLVPFTLRPNGTTKHSVSFAAIIFPHEWAVLGSTVVPRALYFYFYFFLLTIYLVFHFFLQQLLFILTLCFFLE